MQNYEYRLLPHPVTDNVDNEVALNKYGAQGWRLVKSYLYSHQFDNDTVVFVLERSYRLMAAGNKVYD